MMLKPADGPKMEVDVPGHTPTETEPALDVAWAPSRQFCKRLLESYRAQKSGKYLLCELPEWTTVPLKDCNLLYEAEDDLSIKLLEKIPRLQAALVASTDYTPSKWLLEQELSRRTPDSTGARKVPNLSAKTPPSYPTQPLSATSQSVIGASTCEAAPYVPVRFVPGSKDVYTYAADEAMFGLCLSGGGIRSATFSLGVLQTFAEKGFLPALTYLSTVSGGGYIHQFLASWIKREPLTDVIDKIKPTPCDDGPVSSPWQIDWLRRYSSYLTPRRGLLSADTWSLAAVWTRNTFLNQLVLFGFFTACFLVMFAITRTLCDGFSYPVVPTRTPLYWLLLTYCVILLSVLSYMRRATLWQLVIRTWKNLPSRSHKAWINLRIKSRWLVVIGILSLAAFLTAHLTRPPRNNDYATKTQRILIWLHSYCVPPFTRSMSIPSWLLMIVLLGVAVIVVALLWRALCSLTETPVSVGEVPQGSLGNGQVFAFIVLPNFTCSLTLSYLALHKGALNATAVSVALFAYTVGLLLAVTYGGKALCWVAEFSSVSQKWAAFGFLTSAVLIAALCTLFAWAIVTTCDLKFTPLQSMAESTAKLFNSVLSRPSNALGISPAESGFPVTVRSLFVIFLAPLFFWLQFLAIRLQLGILGRFYTEAHREWLARMGAWAAIVSVGWIAMSSLSLAGEHCLDVIFGHSGTHWIGGLFSIGTLHAITLYAGGNGKSDGRPNPRKFFGRSLFDLVAMLGAPLCILVLLLFNSALTARLLSFHLGPVPQGGPASLLPQSPWAKLASYLTQAVPHYAGLWIELALVALGAIFAVRVDINAFSMHAFYRDRLARCYLGATNPKRTPDPFTGFDTHGDTGQGYTLSELVPADFGGVGQAASCDKAGKLAYTGPFPIFCSTLNLTFGQDLAWQERKGASFAFTPMYTGYDVSWTSEIETLETNFNAYVPTETYAFKQGGLPLATVAAISGAALSPNQGFSTIPAVAFLMTIFNVRLGYWLANPRKPNIWPADRNRPSPRVGLASLLSELFGLASDSTKYVCLADGGRFENMGLYELVRRRCRLIVICDGEMESGLYEGIGNAISKCRTDFGAEINLDLTPLIPDPITRRSMQHYQVGTIRYPAPPNGDPTESAKPYYRGNVIYLKTTYVGDEPADILHHKLADPAFPQDSTGNQWFSESDFESYRRLGQLIADRASGDISSCAQQILGSEGWMKRPAPAPPQPRCAYAAA